MIADAAPAERQRELFLKPYVFVLLGVLLALLLGFIAYLLYEQSSDKPFLRSLSDALIQLALLIVIGALVNLSISQFAKLRADREEKRVKWLAARDADRARRLDFLRRVRAVHVQVRHARQLINAHMSGKTYGEQLRILMLVGPGLEEISEDLREAENLFGRDHALIVESIESLIDYLQQGAKEYIRCHEEVDKHARAGEKLDKSIRECDMNWVQQFRNENGDFESGYALPLTKAKSSMRKHVYRSPLSGDSGDYRSSVARADREDLLLFRR